MFGEEEYRKSLDLENDDAPCWKIPSGGITPLLLVGIPYVYSYYGLHCMETKKRRERIIKGEIH